MPDVFWLEVFASVGSSSDKLVLTAHFPVPLDFVFAFHDQEELGPRMLARIAKRTGLSLEDL